MAKLAQDTFQLPADVKERVTEIAGQFGYLRNGQPSRSAVYREMLEYVLATFPEFLKWRSDLRRKPRRIVTKHKIA